MNKEINNSASANELQKNKKTELETTERRYSGQRRSFPSFIKKEALEIKRVVKVTKGGRRFSYACLILVKDENKKAVAFAYSGGKEVLSAIRKSSREAQKKLISYFPEKVRTIPRDVTVNYKATKIFLKPAPVGSGVKAGGVLNKLFKFLEIEDVSAKIIGSRNKLNVIRAAFMALDKLTFKKYDY